MYAHNPYPEQPQRETPTSGACKKCPSITMASLEKLQVEVQRAWPGKHMWLTEYGYQTNPPDKKLGVSYALQAKYIGEAALRVYRAARVDMLIHFIVRDEPNLAAWQSGFMTTKGKKKPSYDAYRFPLTVASERARGRLCGARSGREAGSGRTGSRSSAAAGVRSAAPRRRTPAAISRAL